MAKLVEIRIHPDFATYSGALKPEEFRCLEEAIVSVGRTDSPLVVWKETGFLIPGHNRYEIARRRKIPFDVTELSFQDELDVKCWMDVQECGHRHRTEIGADTDELPDQGSPPDVAGPRFSSLRAAGRKPCNRPRPEFVI